jgi:hypothetical protein
MGETDAIGLSDRVNTRDRERKRSRMTLELLV